MPPMADGGCAVVKAGLPPIRLMRRRIGRLGAALIGVGLLLTAAGAETDERSAILLEVKGAIGPASADYILRGIAAAEERGTHVLVLRLDTPGGLDSSMRDIIQGILAAEVPVAAYVTPSGARAASAGTYILYASHIAAMAPATTLGAATPVQLGGPPTPFSEPRQPAQQPAEQPADGKQAEKDGTDGDGQETEKKPTVPADDAMSAKAINDAAAYIRGLAALRGRNADWAERAVREAASLSAEEALAQRVIDVVAADVPDLLRQIDGRTVEVAGRSAKIDSKDLTLAALDPDWRTRLLAIITDPNVALILMMIGTYGLIFEFMNPGAVFPGVLGAIALLLALYSLNVLPVSFAGIGLVLVGIVLIAAEPFVISHGILAIGGGVAFLIGATMLFDEDIPGMEISWPVMTVAVGLSTALFLAVLTMAVRSRRRRVVSGREEMVGATGRVVSWAKDHGQVFVHGERWQAESAAALSPGQTVRVTALHDLTLTVEPER
jgi:membrane-bound serine protease (ClpP class)